MHPPVGFDHLGGLLGVVEVPDHDVVAAHDDLALLAGRQRPHVVVDDAHLDVAYGRPDVRATVSGSSSWLQIVAVPVHSVRP